MLLLRLAFANALRHKLRTALTVLGLVIAIVAFGLLQTVVHAWFAGADLASASRIVTRNATSLAFQLPLSYLPKIRAIEGVRGVTHSNWFGGIYKDERQRFPQFAIDVRSFLPLYPELALTEDERYAFQRDRRGAIIGTKLAQTYGLKLGDRITLKGTIYPGDYDLVVRGIFQYRGANVTADLSNLYFHYDYLNERLRQNTPRRADGVGVFIVEVERPELAASVARAIDESFRNSPAETLSETEKAFQLGFVSMTEALVTMIRGVSFVVIVIILAVCANTMAMTVRERLAEYATLKALGFGPPAVAGLIYGESLAITLAGGLLGMALTVPVAALFGDFVSRVFPVFSVPPETYLMQFACALVVGVAAALLPGWRAARVNVVEGLRAVG